MKYSIFHKIKIEKVFKILIICGLLSLIFIIHSQKIEFSSIDLGRHLENGKVLWQNSQVLYTNLYSYTETNFPFINHHWFAGVVFYTIYLWGGFKLLSLFNALLAVLIFALTFNFARKKSNFYLASFLSLPVIFLLTERINIRPEAFSYLFIILTWLIIDRVATTKNYRRLYWLVPIFILWVNLHIYFFIGLALLGFKALAEFLPPLGQRLTSFPDRWQLAWRRAGPWIKNFILLTLVCLINPNTWRGLIYPFVILRHYGYQIAENKSIFYLSHLMVNYNFIIFKVLLLLLILSWALNWLISKKLQLFSTFLMIFFAGLGLFASRNISLFALIALVLISTNLMSLKNGFNKKVLINLIYQKIKPLYLSITLLILIIVSLLYLGSNFISQQNFIKNSFGWGLATGSTNASNFFKDHKLKGPIFNNYDLGSALIFWLYPQERVFVDNRPEAYPVKFFENIYKPLQNNPVVWKKISNQYHFQTIFFAYTDSTPWAQKFLPFILKDKNWSLVYFGRYSLILLNKKTTNPLVIKKLTLNNLALRARLRHLSLHSNLREKFNLAFLAQELGQEDIAQVIYQNILFTFPNNRQALFSLGSLYAHSQDALDLQVALNYFSRAFQAGYHLPAVYNQEALVYWRLGNYQQAAQSWRKAQNLDRNNITARHYLQEVKSLQAVGKLPLFK